VILTNIKNKYLKKKIILKILEMEKSSLAILTLLLVTLGGVMYGLQQEEEAVQAPPANGKIFGAYFANWA
jgi:hypothetical protein